MKNKEDGSAHSILYQTLFNCYMKEMEEKTKELILKINSFDTYCYLFQQISNPQKIIDMIFNLTYFYDQNFIGNKDFIHIPNINKITQNIRKYPTILITRKNQYDIEEILGATTIRTEENDYITDNPFFPTKNEIVLSITGVLSKKNILDQNGKKITGIGKELFKSSIKGAYNLNNIRKVRLICEIDCRNIISLNSITKAVKELKEENVNVQTFITGYYEIYDKSQNLTEAPTFVLEIDLNENKKLSNTLAEFSYIHCDRTNLFSNLADVLKRNTKQRNIYFNNYKKNIIKYQDIEPINISNIKLEIGTSIDGNDRVPRFGTLETQYVFNDERKYERRNII